MTETPRQDEWAAVLEAVSVYAPTGDAAQRVMRKVDAARAADAARHQQEIADLKAERELALQVQRRAARELACWRCGTWRKRADEAEAHCATLTAALEEVTRDMDRAGGDGYGMPECPRCRLSSDDDRVEGYSHDATCELVKARAALAAAPQGDKS